MTTTMTKPVEDFTGRAGGRVSQVRVVRSEWTKFWSLRSSWWTLAIAVALTIGLGAIIAAVEGSSYHALSPADKASFSPVSYSLSGLNISILAVGVLGVLLVSGEYSSGMIRSSLTAVPKRLPVLWAKVAILVPVAFVVMLIASLVAFFVGQALLDGYRLGVGLGAAGALRSVIGAALAVTVVGVIGVALGALLRNTAGGVSIFVGVFFVLPPIARLLSSSWPNAINAYLPDSAAAALFRSGTGASDLLGWWPGLIVLCAYAVVLVGVAAWLLRKRDA